MDLLKRLAGLLGEDDHARAARLEQEARAQEARGDRAAALSSRRAVVDACRALSRKYPRERGNLAAALLNLGTLLAALDDREGLDSALKGVEILRELSASNPGVRVVLALAYRTLAFIQWSFRLGPVAIESAQASISLYGELRTERPKELRLEHAAVLSYLAALLSDQGTRQRARDIAFEALALHREIAADDPGAHPDELARCLLVLSRIEHDLGLQYDAIHSAEAAVDLVRGADREPGEMAVLIRGLGNLSGYLGGADRARQAFQAASEAVAHARQLATKNPHFYLGDLARSLLNLATQQGRVGLRQEAASSAREAVTLHRELVQKGGPMLDAALGGLAGSLGTLSMCEGKLGATSEALETAAESVALRRKLAASGSEEAIEGLAATLTNFGIAQGQCGLLEAARDSQLEVVALYRRLIGGDSERHLANLARSLSNLGVGHRRLGC
jgi:tetratricopeptide (TPR) repeat protein